MSQYADVAVLDAIRANEGAYVSVIIDAATRATGKPQAVRVAYWHLLSDRVITRSPAGEVRLSQVADRGRTP